MKVWINQNIKNMNQGDAMDLETMYPWYTLESDANVVCQMMYDLGISWYIWERDWCVFPNVACQGKNALFNLHWLHRIGKVIIWRTVLLYCLPVAPCVTPNFQLTSPKIGILRNGIEIIAIWFHFSPPYI